MKLFRRRACYSETLWYDQIVLDDDEGSAKGEDCDLIHQDSEPRECTSTQFEVAENVEEISPDALDEVETRKVADVLANGPERYAISRMALQEVREWLADKLCSGTGDEETVR